MSCLRQCAGPGHCRLVYFPWALGGSFLGRISWAGPPWCLETSAMASGTGRKAASALQSSSRKTTAPHHNRSTIQNRTVQYTQSSRLRGLQHAWAPGSGPWLWPPQHVMHMPSCNQSHADAYVHFAPHFQICFSASGALFNTEAIFRFAS